MALTTERIGSKMENNNPFIGTWKLISWENTGPDGEVTFPYGKHPVGYLLYTENGHMAAEIMDPDRHQHDAGFAVEPAFAQTLADEDRLAAYNTYLSYCGTYSYCIEDGVMIHHVKAGLIPSWVGNDQHRHFTLKDGKLYLGDKRAQLIWERVCHV
jgi:hypothetical protein